MSYLIVNGNNISTVDGEFDNVVQDLFGDSFVDYLDMTYENKVFRVWTLDNSKNLKGLEYNFKLSRIARTDIYGPVLISSPKYEPIHYRTVEEYLPPELLYTLSVIIREVS